MTAERKLPLTSAFEQVVVVARREVPDVHHCRPVARMGGHVMGGDLRRPEESVSGDTGIEVVNLNLRR